MQYAHTYMIQKQLKNIILYSYSCLNFPLIYYTCRLFIKVVIRVSFATDIYVVVQFCPWLNFYLSLFLTHYHTLPYTKTKEN